MRKMIFFVIFFVLSLSVSLYSTYQVAEVYVCAESAEMANIEAMARVSRNDLYIVSYCNCSGVDRDMKSKVTGGVCNESTTVFYCTCVGRERY